MVSLDLARSHHGFIDASAGASATFVEVWTAWTMVVAVSGSTIECTTVAFIVFLAVF
jgi:hypothetical protein